MERRRQVAQALLRVVESEGLEAASIPRIARELGATTGLVQTYFRTKDELLIFAARYLGEVMNARVAAALAACDPKDIRQRLLISLSVLTGADESSPAEARIWLAFLARAAFHPALREVHVAGSREIRDRCRDSLRLARRLDLLSAGLDDQDEAVALLAFTDGLTLQRAVEPELMSADRVRHALSHYLDRLFDHPHLGEAL
ncbi:TetR/AcrR family transcriptional regulator [Streptomyces sp. NPDC051243]|uniref:TetR/AcrR family transcriptional regulator n=1 Tax=Streptomyces sp. NPDC051243 TaxID=3365646 RepID=UPI0037AF5902